MFPEQLQLLLLANFCFDCMPNYPASTTVQASCPVLAPSTSLPPSPYPLTLPLPLTHFPYPHPHWPHHSHFNLPHFLPHHPLPNLLLPHLNSFTFPAPFTKLK
jgi:hypothetical protein